MLYDGLSNPGNPYFDPTYDPQSLATCAAITDGVARSKNTRAKLGKGFTDDVEPNRAAITMTKRLRDKRRRLHDAAVAQLEE